jgi:uncharacterized membrane protein YvbJ
MFGSKRKKNKKPRFFCDNCGTEVPRDEVKCPECGRYFSSVRCPACGFTGEVSSFKGGCPVCGYSSKAGSEKNNDASRANPQESKKPKGALPVWAYILSASVLIAILTALLFIVSR